MELSVGMYVRAENGTIAKITKHEHYWINNEEWNYICTDIGCLIDIELIIKASHTLLGNGEEPCLIEEGDYVNGMEVLDADWINEDGEYEEGLAFPMYASDDLDVIENWQPLKYTKIKTIVTKEQFSQMEYKLED